MRKNNICKFITEPSAELLEIECFVYETDRFTMAKETVERGNRAILISQGSGEILFDSIPLSFNAGELIFAFNDETTKVVSDNCEYMYIRFSGARCDSLFKRFGISKLNRRFIGFDGTIPIWQKTLSKSSEKNIDLAAEGILLYTFSKLANEVSEKSDAISKIIEITESNFSDSELCISEIARQLNYNPKYLSHMFKAKTGSNYSEYLKNTRVKFAVSLFDSGVDSVKNVAALSGFSDPLYFSSVFKASIGMSPKDYRSQKAKK